MRRDLKNLGIFLAKENEEGESRYAGGTGL